MSAEKCPKCRSGVWKYHPGGHLDFQCYSFTFDGEFRQSEKCEVTERAVKAEDECVRLRAAIEEAWWEGWEDHETSGHLYGDHSWEKSRAKRVMEGHP